VGKVEQAETALGAEMRLAATKTSKMSGDKEAGKIVRRELNKVFTMGTLVDPNLLSDDHANHCLSIYEQSLGDDEGIYIGIAFLDAPTSEISLGFWKDDVCRTRLETAVRQLRVKELLHMKACSPIVYACHQLIRILGQFIAAYLPCS